MIKTGGVVGLSQNSIPLVRSDLGAPELVSEVRVVLLGLRGLL